MRLLRRYPLAPDQVLHYLDDGSSVYLIARHAPKHVNVFTFGLESLEAVRHYPLIFTFRPARGCVDNDFLYLPDRYGFVIAYDKFSGHVGQAISLGGGLAAGDLQQSERYVYAVSGVLLSNGVDVDSKHYCVCILDKETGQKRSQTKLVQNKPLYVHPEGDGFWLVAGNLLQRYADFGRMEHEIEMPFAPSFEPVWTSEEVIYFNAGGLISGFSSNGQPRYGHRLPASDVVPAHAKGRSFWVSDRTVYVIEGDAVMQVVVPHALKGALLAAEDRIFGVDEAGEIVRISVESLDVTRSSLGRGFKGPLWSHGSILFATDREGNLCQISE